MKKVLAVILLTSALSGCAVWDAYFMAKFDVNEYQYITRIRTHAQLGIPKCGTDAVVEHVKYIHVVSQEYKNYAEMIPRNENSFQLADTLTTITDEFYKRYQGDKPPSTVYCKAKFAAIERSAENIQKVIGAKPR
jgi:hypothetical protein